MQTIYKYASLLFFTTSCAYGQAPSAAVQALERSGIKVIAKGKLTEAQAKFYWQNTSVDDEGYVRVVTNDAYVRLLQAFSSHPKYRKISEPHRAVGPFKLIGTLQEDPQRTNDIYEDSAGSRLVVTKWKYAEAGATITLSEDFLNGDLDGTPCAFALATSLNSDLGLWKVVFWREGTAFEIYVEDILSRNGKTSRPFQSIIEISRNIAKLN